MKSLFIIRGFLMVGAVYVVWLAYPIDLTSIDLGRLLVTGKTILTSPQQIGDVLYTNFFTYTNTDYPIVNHHWMGAVLLYLMHLIGGFTGMHIFFIAMHVITLAIYFHLAQKRSNTWIAFAVTLPLVILLGERMEVRPEGFGYLLSALVLYILDEYRFGNIKEKWLWTLPVLMVLWINIHVSFIIGLLFIGAFTASALWDARSEPEAKQPAKKLLIVLGVSLLATLLNPATIHGVLYPFQVVQEHGLMIVENQSILFLENWGLKKVSFFLMKVITIFLALATLALLNKRRIAEPLPYLLITFPLVILALFAARHITSVGFILIPTFAYLTHILLEESEEHRGSLLGTIVPTTLIVCALVGGIAHFPLLARRAHGVGLKENVTSAAEFIQEHKLHGPIFNNFDVAGYLLYYTFPEEHVFVDNRPEAHSVEFFTETYIPMMEDGSTWREKSMEYGINMIVMNYRDRSSWIPTFIVERLRDAEWAPIFADESIVIFLKQTPENSEVISRFRVPPDTFVF